MNAYDKVARGERMAAQYKKEKFAIGHLWRTDDYVRRVAARIVGRFRAFYEGRGVWVGGGRGGLSMARGLVWG